MKADEVYGALKKRIDEGSSGSSGKVITYTARTDEYGWFRVPIDQECSNYCVFVGLDHLLYTFLPIGIYEHHWLFKVYWLNDSGSMSVTRNTEFTAKFLVG